MKRRPYYQIYTASLSKEESTLVSSTLRTQVVEHATTEDILCVDMENQSNLQKMEAVLQNSVYRSVQDMIPDVGPSDARDPDCSICHIQFETEDVLLKHSQCKTSWHADCVLKWLTDNTSCPWCRAELRRSSNARTRDARTRDARTRNARTRDARTRDARTRDARMRDAQREIDDAREQYEHVREQDQVPFGQLVAEIHRLRLSRRTLRRASM